MRRSHSITLVKVLLATVVYSAGLADLVLGRVEGGVLPLQSQTGNFQDDNDANINWTVVAEPANIANLEQITITIDWVKNNNTRTFEVIRLIYQDPNATTNNLKTS